MNYKQNFCKRTRRKELRYTEKKLLIRRFFLLKDSLSAESLLFYVDLDREHTESLILFFNLAFHAL